MGTGSRSPHLFPKMKHKIYQIGTIQGTGEPLEADIAIKGAKRIIGIQLNGSDRQSLVLRGRVGFRLNGVEKFPRNFPAHNFIAGVQVEPDKRFVSVDWEVGDGRLFVEFLDEDNTQNPFANYSVELILLVEE